MFRRFFPMLLVVLLTAAVVPPAAAQVPQLINYQGRVRVSGADFSGTGQFKFALISSSGSTTFWSNDGSSTAGSQPANAVALPVQGGLYQVLLGDATRPNMTALTPGVFQNADIYLRVWFSDGTNGWQQLTPDQRVAAVGYAVTSTKLAPGAVTSSALAPNAVTENLNAAGQGTVPSGGALVSTDPNSASLLAAGYVKAGSLTSGDAWTAIAGGTARDRAASVWTGTEMLIWGDGPEGWRYNPITNVWTAMSTTGQPTNRENPLAVWTGTEMIVWGGRISGSYPVSGGRYNPTTDTWTNMSQAGVPAGRFNSTAVWTGGEMIIFGGNNGAAVIGDTARYNPAIGAGGTWTAITAANAPGARQLHTAVWTGTEMIVHGGLNDAAGITYGDCHRLNPSGAGTWTTGAVASGARYSHSAVWTGTDMLVWGGSVFAVTPATLATGAAYRPSSNAWSNLNTAGAPEARFQHRAVWTGSEMIVWGGSTSASALVYTGTGGRYNPVSGIWTSMSTTNSPAARVNPNLEWTGAELIVWGGSNGAGLNAGGRFRAGQIFYLYQRP